MSSDESEDHQLTQDESTQNDEIQYKIISGLRSDSKLLFTSTDNQLFRKCTKYKDKGYWYRCRITSCGAHVFLDFKTQKCFVKSLHSHEFNQKAMYDEIVVKTLIKNDCKAVGLRSTSENVSQIFNRHSLENQHVQLNLTKMERNLYRCQRISMPASPKTAREVELEFSNEEMMRTYGFSQFQDGETPLKFYRTTYTCDTFSYCIFASESIIRNITAHIALNRRNYLIDATFKVCPMGEFNQFLIIHIEYMKTTIPFIFVLMSRKTEACYKHLFQYINTNIFSLEGKSFMTDYECAMRSALRKVYPQANLYACWFHFCQAVKRNASKIPGFVTSLRNNKDAMEIYGKFLCLPLLPVNDIDIVFHLLKAEANNFNAALFRRFIKYYDKQWIQKETASNISVYGRHTRTTNALEAYNGVIGRRLPKKGHFFHFLKLLLAEEYSKSRDFASLIRTGGESGRKRRYRGRHERIMEATEELNKKEILPIEFLRRVLLDGDKIHKGFVEFDNVGDYDDAEPEDESDGNEPNNTINNAPERSVDCEICYVNKKCILLMPCKHICMCDVCFNKLKTNAADYINSGNDEATTIRCPMCRESVVVEDSLHVFL